MILIYSKERILRSENYFPSISPSDYPEVCSNKHINWGKKIYELKYDKGMTPYILTVDNFNHSYWTYMFQAIPGSQIKPGKKPHTKQYVFCNASIKSSTKNSPPDFQKESPGVIISLRDSTQRKLLHFTLSVSIDAYRYTNEDYDFDAVMQDLVKNIHIIKQQDGNLLLNMYASEGGDKLFHYEITQINDMFIEQYNIQLMSTDQGKTWEWKSPL